MIKKISGYLFIIIIVSIIYPVLSYGQTASSNLLDLTVSPTNPEPLQSVTANLQSYSYDLDRSEITWSVNGVIKKTEIGLKNFTAQAGKNGEKTTITVSVNVPGDSPKEISASFAPAVVDLVYESLAYAPPFYKGKILNPTQGVVLVVALPELINSAGGKIPVNNLIYSWKKNDRVEQASSGFGKNTFMFSGSVPVRDTLIEVTVSSLDGSVSAYKSVNITNIPPKILFYENSPVYGIMFNKAIVNPVNMLADEFGILAMPYFYSVGYATTPDLNFAWTMNSQPVGNQDPKNSFTVRTDVAGSGTANIGLKISNNVRIFQFTDSKYSVNFNKQ